MPEMPMGPWAERGKGMCMRHPRHFPLIYPRIPPPAQASQLDQLAADPSAQELAAWQARLLSAAAGAVQREWQDSTSAP